MTMVDEALLLSIGIEVTEVKGDELVALCPGHLARVGRADNNPSWSINAETGISFCFSCGYKASLVHLVSDQLQITSEEASRWLVSTLKVDLEEISRRLEDIKDAYANPFRLVPMSEARLAVYSDPPEEALAARRLTLEACQQHSVRWDPKTGSWIIPIREPDSNRLLGWQEKAQDGRGFKNRPAGVQKSATLFGLDCYTGGQMVLVESPLDAVRLTSLGIPGGVSSYGSRVSIDQIHLLRRADGLVLAMDNDAAGHKSTETLFEESRRLGFEFWVFDYGTSTAKDVGDMGMVDVMLGVANARHCAYGLGVWA